MSKKLTKTKLTAALKAAGNFRGAAEALGVSMGTVSRAVKEFGIVWKKCGRPKKIQTKTALKPYCDGYTWEEIGEAFGVSGATIRAAFKFHGLRKVDRRNKRDKYYCD